MLEVEPAAMLARRFDHESAEEAGRGTVREREPGQQAKQRRITRREAEGIRDRRPGVDAPHRPAVDEHRDEDQGLFLGRVVRSSCAPRAARNRASGRTAGSTPSRHGCRRAARTPPAARHTFVADRVQPRRRPRSSPVPPNHTIALSTSELGSASRRAWLPSASHANGAESRASSRDGRARAAGA